MSSGKIIIAGAGIGGLTLAQMLRKANIEFEIYERDKDSGAREQGWALGLSYALPVLREYLTLMDSDVSSVAVPVIGGDKSGGGGILMLDGENGHELVRIEVPGGEIMIVNRVRLRLWLQQGLKINWDKRYMSHVCENGGVTVTFEDGSVVHGSALIGADGVNSKVRTLLFAEKPQVPEVAPVSMIVGVRNLPRSEFERLTELVSPGYQVTAVHNNKRIFTIMRNISEDREVAEYIWYMSKLNENPTEVSHLAKPELLEQAKLDAEIFNGPLKSLIQNTTLKDEVVCQTLRVLLLDEIPSGVVTLLGDAAHAMPPFRGEGGQTAMLDALKLGKVLTEAYASGGPVDFAKAFKVYEAEMLERGRAAAQGSKEAVFQTHRPLKDWRESVDDFVKLQTAAHHTRKVEL